MEKEEELRAISDSTGIDIGRIDVKTVNNAMEVSDSAGASEKVAAQVTNSSMEKLNIFSKEASSQILIKDLMSFLQSNGDNTINYYSTNPPTDVDGSICPKLGYSVHVVDDNIYNWRVCIYKFPNLPVGSASARQEEDTLEYGLMLLESVHGYNYVELSLKFQMNIHPFFPPSVTLVRPRLSGGVLERIAALDTLKVASWDPIRGIQAVISDVMVELKRHARIDVESLRNDLVRYPQSAYMPLETHLLQLGLLASTEANLVTVERVLAASSMEDAGVVASPSPVPPAATAVSVADRTESMPIGDSKSTVLSVPPLPVVIPEVPGDRSESKWARVMARVVVVTRGTSAPIGVCRRSRTR